MLRKLAGQTATYGISSIVAKFLNYLLVPYLTRVMGTAEYGVVTDIYALIPLVLVILTMGLETGYFRFAGQAENQTQRNALFATSWGAVSYMAICFFALVMLFLRPIAGAMEYADYPSYVALMAGVIALDAISAIPYARLREQGRATRFVVVRTVSVVINVLLCVFFFSVLPHLADNYSFFDSIYDPTFKAGYAFVANLVASAVTLLLLLPSCAGVAPKVDLKLLRNIAIYSMPLLLSGIAGTANEFIDRQMIKYLVPEDVAMSSLGIYGAVVKIGVVLILFTQMYRFAAEPFFLSSFKKDDFVKVNAEALKFFIIISVTLFLAITLFSDVIALILGQDFREGMYILPVVMVANMFSGVLLNLSFWYKKSGQTKYAIYVTGLGLGSNLLFGFILIPTMGYYGAAIARLISEVVMVAISYLLNQKYCATPYDLRRIGLYAAVGAVLFFTGELTEYLGDIPRYGINLLLVAGFISFAAKRENISIKRLIKR